MTRIQLYAGAAVLALIVAACSTSATDVVQDERGRKGTTQIAQDEKAEADLSIATGSRVGPTSEPKRAPGEAYVVPPPPPPSIAAAPMMRADGRLANAGGHATAAQTAPQPFPGDVNRENYEHNKINALKLTHEEPVSTFSIDVDTASYSNVRRMLNQGHLPPRDAVRIEELINYFDYDYDLPKSKAQPFETTVRIIPAPWARGAS